MARAPCEAVGRPTPKSVAVENRSGDVERRAHGLFGHRRRDEPEQRRYDDPSHSLHRLVLSPSLRIAPHSDSNPPTDGSGGSEPRSPPIDHPAAVVELRRAAPNVRLPPSRFGRIEGQTHNPVVAHVIA